MNRLFATRPLLQVFDFTDGADVGIEFTTGGHCVLEFETENTHMKLTIPRDALIEVAIENLRMLQANEED